MSARGPSVPGPVRAVGALLLAAALLAVALPSAAGPAAAAPGRGAAARQQDAAGSPATTPATAEQNPDVGSPGLDPPPGIGLSRAVAALELTSPELDEARAELEGLQEQLASDSTRRDELEPELARLRGEVDALRAVVARRALQVDKIDRSLARARTAVREIAIEWYVTGFGALEGLDPALTSRDRERLERQYVLSEAAAGAALDDERHLDGRLATVRAEHDELEARRAATAGRVAELAAELEQLNRGVDEATRLIPGAELRVQEASMRARVVGTDLSATALDAYWRAQRALELGDPSCGVRWWVLAGIGRTESFHGTYRGSTLAIDGRVDPPIFGPLLDGSMPFAIVRDSDGGAIDGVATTDRATGPMQFLPSTWRMVGVDATDDGVADPQNLFDAAASAGVYLCRSGPGLDTDDRLRASLFTYNRSLAYVQVVLDRGNDYRDAVGLER